PEDPGRHDHRGADAAHRRGAPTHSFLTLLSPPFSRRGARVAGGVVFGAILWASAGIDPGGEFSMFLRRLVVFALAAAWLPAAWCQGYPSKPVRVIVTFPSAILRPSSTSPRDLSC